MHAVKLKLAVKPKYDLKQTVNDNFCFLECQDKFEDARGRKGLVLG